MANNPFMPPKFIDTVPKGGWQAATGPREDGPGAHTNPANSTTVVYYNGQDQTFFINMAYAKPPRHTSPGAADKSMSKIP